MLDAWSNFARFIIWQHQVENMNCQSNNLLFSKKKNRIELIFIAIFWHRGRLWEEMEKETIRTRNIWQFIHLEAKSNRSIFVSFETIIQKRRDRGRESERAIATKIPNLWSKNRQDRILVHVYYSQKNEFASQRSNIVLTKNGRTWNGRKIKYRKTALELSSIHPTRASNSNRHSHIRT